MLCTLQQINSPSELKMGEIFLRRNWNHAASNWRTKNRVARRDNHGPPPMRPIIISAWTDKPWRTTRPAKRVRNAQGIYYGTLTSSCNSLAQHKVDCKHALLLAQRRLYDGSSSYRAHATLFAIIVPLNRPSTIFCAHGIHPRTSV